MNKLLLPQVNIAHIIFIGIISSQFEKIIKRLLFLVFEIFCRMISKLCNSLERSRFSCIKIILFLFKINYFLDIKYIVNLNFLIFFFKKNYKKYVACTRYYLHLFFFKQIFFTHNIYCYSSSSEYCKINTYRYIARKFAIFSNQMCACTRIKELWILSLYKFKRISF